MELLFNIIIYSQCAHVKVTMIPLVFFLQLDDGVVFLFFVYKVLSCILCLMVAMDIEDCVVISAVSIAQVHK